MYTGPEESISTIIVLCLFLLLILSLIILRYVFLYQREKHQHMREVAALQDTFNNTLLSSKLEMQEQTLDHISKELHANFSHLVSLININLTEILINVPPEMVENVKETKSLARHLMSELKILSASLNTDHIMRIGFTAALKQELKRVERHYEVTFTVTGSERLLKPESAIILFRLCQEILNNILKHAQARSIKASVSYSPDFITIIIADDGIGFNLEQAYSQSAEKESTGLGNIVKRAKLINGEVKINTVINKGTSIRVAVPVSAE
jgi:signal transduction histidine kinase